MRAERRQIRLSRAEGLRHPAIPGAAAAVVDGVAAPYHAEVADDALVAGLAVEDADAATAFVRRFQAKVFGMAVSVTRDPALADDVAQEAFLRAWRSASTYDSVRGSVAAWLLTITRNVAIDAVRARRAMPSEDDELDRLLQSTLGASAGNDVTGEAAAAKVDAARAVERLRRIPPDQARAVVLAVFGGCTAEEIGLREGIPLGTAKTRIRTGLRRLRQWAADGAALGSETGDE
jgi:RNA polymerase sigma factor (sigma-70 family)